MSEQPVPFPFATEIPQYGDVFTAGRGLLSEMAIYNELVASKESREINSPLPSIIGHVPEEEQDAFRWFHLRGHNASSTDGEPNTIRNFVSQFKDAMPETARILLTDMEQLKIPGLALTDIKVLSEFARVSQTPDQKQWPWHGDQDLYLIRENKPTEFLEGRAKVKGDGGNISVQDLLDVGRPLTSPSFAILRKSPLAIHRASQATESGISKILLFTTNLHSKAA